MTASMFKCPFNIEHGVVAMLGRVRERRWKVPQTFGRAGRDKKLQAVGVQMYWPGQKGLLIWIFY